MQKLIYMPRQLFKKVQGMIARTYILTVIAVEEGTPRVSAWAYLLQEMIDGTAIQISQGSMLIERNGETNASQERAILVGTNVGTRECAAGSQVFIQSTDEKFVRRLQKHADQAAINYGSSPLKDVLKQYAEAKTVYFIEPRKLPKGKMNKNLGIIVENLARNTLAKSASDKRIVALVKA